MPPTTPLPAGFAEAYTLSGCSDLDHCGVFRRVAARCASGGRCPGGWGEFSEFSGSTDPSLCNGVPVYQKGGGDGPVLLRYEHSGSFRSDGYTLWSVGDSSALETCTGSSLYSGRNYHQAYIDGSWIDQAGSGPPTAPAYNTGFNTDTNTDTNTDNGGIEWADYDASPYCTSGCGITIVTGGR